MCSQKYRHGHCALLTLTRHEKQMYTMIFLNKEKKKKAVISIAPYLTHKGEYTALCKINNSVYIKTSKIINYVVIIL